MNSLAVLSSLALLTRCVIAATSPQPLLPIGANSTLWAAPRPNSLFLGDIRAKVALSAADVAAGPTATAQIFWRRCEPNPALKAVVVTDASGADVPSKVLSLQAECGSVSITHGGKTGPFFVYYLPHYQSGGGAGVHFHWFNCTSQGRQCVLDDSAAADACATVDAEAAARVVGLENRPNAVASQDHTPSGQAFHGYTRMEQVATPTELATLPTGVLLFMEKREDSVRMFDLVPAHWARGGEVRSMSATAAGGEFFSFQAGVYANGKNASRIAVKFSALVSATEGAAPVPASLMH